MTRLAACMVAHVFFQGSDHPMGVLGGSGKIASLQSHCRHMKWLNPVFNVLEGRLLHSCIKFTKWQQCNSATAANPAPGSQLLTQGPSPTAGTRASEQQAPRLDSNQQQQLSSSSRPQS
jgi:hypothetical protein